MRIAVISDTHGLLRPEVKEILHTCDAVIHGGDINSQKILDEIKIAAKEECPFYVVRGNNDKEWAKDIPVTLQFGLEGCLFFLVHNKKEVPQELQDTDIVIYGHSHKYSEEVIDGRLWLNPGSCCKRRFSLPITMAILNLEQGKWKVEKIDIPQEQKNTEVILPEQNKVKIIEEIFRRMDKGQIVNEIAVKMKLDKKVVEEICRIRVTHPGVTPNGVVDKMEVNSIVER